MNASQLSLGVGLYVWVAYYMCVFLPYRVLYEEYQDFGRRSAQVTVWCGVACGLYSASRPPSPYSATWLRAVQEMIDDNVHA